MSREGALLGLALGCGLLLLWTSTWPRSPGGRAGRAPRRRRLADDLVQAGVSGVGPGAVTTASLVVGVVTGLLALAATGVPAIAVCLGAGASAAPVLWIRARARRARAAVRGLWPEAVDDLVSAARAGLSLPEALSQPGPARSAAAASGLRRVRPRLPRERTLRHRPRRVKGPSGRSGRRPHRGGAAHRARGGRHRPRTPAAHPRRVPARRGRDQVRAWRPGRAWTVNAARLAVAAPWVVLLLLSTRPEAVSAYARPSGALVLVTGAALTTAAYRAMLRIGRLPDEQRVLV
nr:hypothetical protein [Angustibacter aerolatus]